MVTWLVPTQPWLSGTGSAAGKGVEGTTLSRAGKGAHTSNSRDSSRATHHLHTLHPPTTICTCFTHPPSAHSLVPPWGQQDDEDNQQVDQGGVWVAALESAGCQAQGDCSTEELGQPQWRVNDPPVVPRLGAGRSLRHCGLQLAGRLGLAGRRRCWRRRPAGKGVEGHNPQQGWQGCAHKQQQGPHTGYQPASSSCYIPC